MSRERRASRRASKQSQNHGRPTVTEVLEPRRLFSGDPLHIHDEHEAVDLSVPFVDDVPGAGTRFQLNGRWTNTASGGTGSTGQGIRLTYSIVPDGTILAGSNGEPASPSDFRARLNAIHGSQSTWLPLVEQVFNSWGAISGVTYVYEPNDDGAQPSNSASGVLGVRGDVRIGAHPIDGAYGVLAYNWYPNHGDMTLDSLDLAPGGFMSSTAGNALSLRNVLAHEHGHGLGINHVQPVNNSKLMEPYASLSFDGPQFDDMLAVQRNYGDFYEKGAGNNISANAVNRGTIAASDLVNKLSLATTSDVDFFKFTIDGTSNVSVVVAPLGDPYPQGPQGGTPTTFNPKSQMDLQAQLLGSNGTTVVATANTTVAGLNETFSSSGLAAGTYYIKVSPAPGASNSAQMYSLSTTVTSPVVVGTWTGLGDGVSWNQAANWSGNVIPGSTSDVTITAATAGPIVIGSDMTVRSILTAQPLSIGGDLTVTQSAQFNAPVTLSGTLTAGNLNVGVGGSLVATPGGERIIRTSALSIDGTSQLDLNNNLLIVDYTGSSPVTTLENLVRGGFAGGSWNGNGIRSSSAVAAGGALGIAEASDLDAPSTFGGQTIDATTVLVQYTVAGDTNLDQVVNVTDLGVLASNWQQSGNRWSQGNVDLSADGLVGVGDLGIVASNWQATQAPVPSSAAEKASPTRVADSVLV